MKGPGSQAGAFYVKRINFYLLGRAVLPAVAVLTSA
jgi:hypothetical protein